MQKCFLRLILLEIGEAKLKFLPVLIMRMLNLLQNMNLLVIFATSPVSYTHLHISVLLEQMRREGYEVAVSKPEVILHKDENGKTVEPVEEVVALAPEEYSGTIINKLNLRKGVMIDMVEENGYCRITYEAPTRGLLGYRSEFINDTRGEGTLVRRIKGYTPYKLSLIHIYSGGVVIHNTRASFFPLFFK